MSEGFSYDGFDRLIGFELTSVTGEEVRGTLTVTPALHQPYGLLHGGVLCTLVETVGSVGSAAWFGDRGTVVGTSNHTNLLRAVRDGVLTAVGTPVHQGRTSQLWTVEVRDASDRLVAKGDLRVANLAADPGTAAG